MEKTSLEVILQNEEQRKTGPSCKHGPALLFQRADDKFFACSAARDQSLCPLRVSCQDWNTNGDKIKKYKSQETLQRTNVYVDIETFKSCDESDRAYCHKCGLLFQKSLDWKKHSAHRTESDISIKQLNNPSTILKPLESNKGEAQYLFSSDTIDTFIKIIKHNNFSHIICVGTPTIFERIKSSENMPATLLDLDKRRYSFYRRDEFHCYNMFNNHFFNEDEFELFKKNLKGKDAPCMIIDPPFGGRIEPIAQTIRELSALYGNGDKIIPCILVLPYFMEPQVNNHLPELQMSDYQVEYENHNTFQNNKKKGSPIRFFTNILLKNVPLDQPNVYKYCNKCEKWVGIWNNHCDICKNCTSKNGTTYKHCKSCNRCVKSSWSHCKSCDRCCLKQHACEISLPSQKCFLCNNYGHKKSDCILKTSFEEKSSKETILRRQIVDKKKVNKKKERRKRIRMNIQKHKMLKNASK